MKNHTKNCINIELMKSNIAIGLYIYLHEETNLQTIESLG